MTQEEISQGKILIRRFTNLHLNPLKNRKKWIFRQNEEDDETALLFYYSEVSPKLSFNELMEFLMKLESFEIDGFHYRTIVGSGKYCCIAQVQGKAIVNKWESSHIALEESSSYSWQPNAKLEAIFITILKFIKWFNDQYIPKI